MSATRPGVGETFVWGLDKHTARALLAAAKRVGLDPLHVRTTQNGFIVPNVVAEAASDALQSEPMSDDPDQQF